MRRFFTEPENVDRENETLIIYEDAGHIMKVLRMSCGDRISVFDGSGYEYETEITEISASCMNCRILNVQKSSLEPRTKVTLFQGIPKAGKLDVIVQKAVELGVHKIVPVSCLRSVAKIPVGSRGANKIERLNKISREAAKQCGRGLVPQVAEPVGFCDVISALKNYDLSIMLYEELGHSGEKNLKQVLRSSIGAAAENIAVIIGPEGGIAREEADAFLELGGETFAVGLGRRILRTETAGSTALSIIMYEKDEI